MKERVGEREGERKGEREGGGERDELSRRGHNEEVHQHLDFSRMSANNGYNERDEQPREQQR
jgi:hypothetical protein